jgi:signal transduction histidine kinase
VVQALLDEFLDELWWSYVGPSDEQSPYCPDAGRLCPSSITEPYRTLLTIVVIIGIGLAFWSYWRLARRLVRPVAAMTETIAEMNPQNLGARIRWNGRSRDELRGLSEAIDAMLDRVAVGYESQRRFAANASHELRTPLAVQRTLVEVAITTRDGADPELNRLGAQLLVVNERNERLIEGLLALAESDRGVVGGAPVRLDLLVTDAIGNYTELAEKRGITFRRGLMERTVVGDRVLLERMVSNLIHNAIKYNEGGGWVEVVVAGSPALSVHNSGEHVPAESIWSLFDPFRRLSTDRTNHRDGAGLGLSIVRSIATAHDGYVTAEPGSNGGLRVSVLLPD